MKAELITNVSHDIKTPLTSIINYVDLMKRAKPEDPLILSYLEILDKKSQHLKTLTEDLVEASKASTGNIQINAADIDFVELAEQSNGEFEEKFRERNGPTQCKLLKGVGTGKPLRDCPDCVADASEFLEEFL